MLLGAEDPALLEEIKFVAEDFETRVLDEVQTLAPLPPSVVALAQIASDPDGGQSDVADVLNLDARLLERVLVAANSSGGLRGAETADEAVIALGLARIVTLALLGAVGGLLDPGVPVYRFLPGGQTCHARLSALAVEMLPAGARRELSGDLIAASILHDIGKALIGSLIEPDTERHMKSARAAGLSWIEAELEVLGIEHAEVGRAMCDNWAMPDTVGLAVQYHHTPQLGPADLSHGVAVTNAVADAVRQDLHASAAIADKPRLSDSIAAMGMGISGLEKTIQHTRRIWHANGRP